MPVSAAGEGGVTATHAGLVSGAQQQVLHAVWVHQQGLFHAIALHQHVLQFTSMAAGCWYREKLPVNESRKLFNFTTSGCFMQKPCMPMHKLEFSQNDI